MNFKRWFGKKEKLDFNDGFHSWLKVRCANIFLKKGFKVYFEQKLSSKGRMDVYCFKDKDNKDSHRIGIECLTSVGFDTRRKIELYSGYFDEIIFCFLTNEPCMVKNVRDVILNNIKKFNQKNENISVIFMQKEKFEVHKMLLDYDKINKDRFHRHYILHKNGFREIDMHP